MKDTYFFNLFSSACLFNIDEKILAIFLSKLNKDMLRLSLLVDAANKEDENIDEDALDIVREYADLLYYSEKRYIDCEYDYVITDQIPNDYLCCLFAWYPNLPNYYQYVNFMNDTSLVNEVYEDKLKATIFQLLVNKVINSTQKIIYLYDKEKQSIKFTFFYVEKYNYLLQYGLLDNLSNELSSLISLKKIDIEGIKIIDYLKDVPALKDGEVSLFAKKQDGIFE